MLTSTGRGADFMVPMALRGVGGMAIALMTVLVVSVLQLLGRGGADGNSAKS